MRPPFKRPSCTLLGSAPNDKPNLPPHLASSLPFTFPPSCRDGELSGVLHSPLPRFHATSAPNDGACLAAGRGRNTDVEEDIRHERRGRSERQRMGEAGKWFIYVHKGDDKQSEGRTAIDNIHQCF